MEQRALKILIVDDDDDDAFLTEDLIREGLTKPSPEIDRARSHEEALKLLAETTYDLCMLDYRLGEGTGIGLLQALRSQNITTPIILLTGQGDQEIAVEAMKSGADDYIVKGKLSCELLTKSIRHAIQLHKEAERRKHTEAMLKKSHQELTLAHEELQASLDKLKSAQNQILRSEKLAGIGRLAAGVCHEILNPLNIISGHTQALQMERKEDQSLLEDLGSVTEEIHRIEKIISGLLKFSRKGDVELKYTDINRELESVLSIIQGEMNGEGIEVVREFDSDLPKLLLDNDRMRQVYLNIINNAKYAMSGGGKLTVRTQVLEGKNASQVEPGSSPSNPEKDGFLRICFTDTGPGIKPEHLGKIFDPFFTTKPEDKGTGLGLSVCYSIIEKHGGSLEAESDGKHGTTFLIDLPLSQNQNNESPFLDEVPDMKAGKIILGDSSEVRIGDKAFTVGYPLSNILGNKPKYSEGVINAISGVRNDPKSFQISIPIQPGNSGGPLFNDKGEVIGIVTSSLDAQATSTVAGNFPQNVNFAIKSTFIKNLLPTLPETLISPTGLVPVPVYSESNRPDFINQIQNNIVLLEIER